MGKGQDLFDEIQRKAMAELFAGPIRPRRKMPADAIARREATKRRKYRDRKRAAKVDPIDKRGRSTGARAAILDAMADGAWRTGPEIAKASGRDRDTISAQMAKLEKWGMVGRRPNPDFDQATWDSFKRWGKKGDRRLCKVEFRLLMGREAASLLD